MKLQFSYLHAVNQLNVVTPNNIHNPGTPTTKCCHLILRPIPYPKKALLLYVPYSEPTSFLQTNRVQMGCRLIGLLSIIILNLDRKIPRSP